MKKILFTVILFVVSSISFSTLGQDHTTLGTDFWVSFMWNIDTTQGNNTTGIFVTGPRTCTVTAENPITGWSSSFTATPSGTNQLAIPLAQCFHNNNDCGQVRNKGIHVTASDSICLFSITKGYPSMDFANVLPIDMLGSDYLLQAFPSDRFPTEFLIVAAEDNVVVDITLSCNTANEWTAGSTHTVTLPSAGNTVQILGASNMDISGTRITARNEKKIAVFNGDACVYIPSYSECPSCDHVVEQAVPTPQWGKRFVARGSLRNNGKRDRVRVTALENNCQVHRNGTLESTLNAGETYTYTMSTNSQVDYIQTSTPAVAYQYFPSMNSSAYDGDPSMTTLPPLEQGVREALFMSPSTVLTSNEIDEHNIIIVTSSDNVNSIRLDGVNVGSQFVNIGHSSGCAYLYKAVPAGHHSIQSLSDSTFIAYSFGFGTRCSYGYGVGISSRDLRNPLILVNGSNISNITLCEGDSAVFSIDPGRLTLLSATWHDVTLNRIYSGNPQTITFNTVGLHQINAYITYFFDNDTLNDTLSCVIDVIGSSTTDIFDSICDNNLPYVFHGHYLYADTTLSYHITTPCLFDQVLHLSVFPSYTIHDDTVICQENLPYVWLGQSFWADTTIYLHQSTIHDCDSSVSLFLSIHQGDTTFYDTLVCDSPAPYRWHNLDFYQTDTLLYPHPNEWGCNSLDICSLRFSESETTYFDTTLFTSQLPYHWQGRSITEEGCYPYVIPIEDECDSILMLTLHINDSNCENHTSIWVPNIFTPTRSENNVLQVFTSNIIEANMVIYNRWGMYVTTINPLTETWDGRKNGQLCPQGAYAYKITYRTICSPNAGYVKKGTVVLLH